MYSHFLSILTCLAMLWHSIGGCSWHHDHRDCSASGSLGNPAEISHTEEICSHHHEGDQHPSHHPDPESPGHHGHHCEAENCVYLSSFTPDLAGLFMAQAESASPLDEVLTLQSSTTLLTLDRVVLHTEDLSAQQRCALNQSWLL